MPEAQRETQVEQIQAHARVVLGRYTQAEEYIGWGPDDEVRVASCRELVQADLPAIVEDFYQAIRRHPGARQVLSGEASQIKRLKATLKVWIERLLAGPYDAGYVEQRWHTGWRHVEIGLDRLFAAAAFSRLRTALTQAVIRRYEGPLATLMETLESLHRRLDLDLLIIDDAYQSEYLRQQQHLLAEAIRHLDEGVIITTASDPWPQARIVFANEALMRMTGYSQADVLGQSPAMFFAPEEDMGLISRLDEALRQGNSATAELVHRRRDGSTYQVEMFLTPVVDAARTAAHYVAVLHDVTEQKRAAERLRQSERLAAIGQTVAGLAHESRNAFQRSQACLEMLELELEDRPEALDLVKRIQHAQDHLHLLYEEVRDYAAPITLRRRACDLAQVWRDTWAHLELDRSRKHVALRAETGGLDMTCEVDPLAMEQLFRNILENAITACPSPGEILIHCSETVIDGKAAVRIGFRDTGPGLSPEARERIFDPFFTTKTKGTGLGMAIAQRIVEAHGGRIELGHPQQGAEILVTLPRGGP